MPMGYYYGYDYTWYLLVLPAFLLALWAQFKVKATYSKYSKVRSLRGRTAAEVARQILNDHGLNYVQVDMINGELTDNYDPRSNIVHLSQGVYNSTHLFSGAFDELHPADEHRYPAVRAGGGVPAYHPAGGI